MIQLKTIIWGLFFGIALFAVNIVFFFPLVLWYFDLICSKSDKQQIWSHYFEHSSLWTFQYILVCSNCYIFLNNIREMK